METHTPFIIKLCVSFFALEAAAARLCHPSTTRSALRLAGCCTGTMEQKAPKEESASKGQESLSYQRRMWRNFQEKTKPWLSPKLGSERRGAGGAEGSKKESGLWMFKKKKKQLDRVFSSSQPNLCSSSPVLFEGDKQCLGSDAVPGTSADGLAASKPLSAASGTTGSKPELTAHGSPKLPVSQLIVYQQKSSSLGSACFEKLVVESVVEAGEKEQLRDSVSKGASVNVSGVTTNGYCKANIRKNEMKEASFMTVGPRRARCPCPVMRSPVFRFTAFLLESCGLCGCTGQMTIPM